MTQLDASSAVLSPPLTGFCPPPLPTRAASASPPPAPVPPPAAEITPPPLPASAEFSPTLAAVGDWLRQTPSWLVSMVFHLTLVIVMALWVAKVEYVGSGGDDDLYALQTETTMNLDAPESALEEPEPIEIPLEANQDIKPLPPSEMPITENIEEQFTESMFSPTEAAPPLNAQLADEGTIVVGDAGGLAALTIGDDPADLLKGRLSESARKALVKADGGSDESEAAVALALKWLAAHQLADGSWSFDHQRSPKCNKKCDHPGNLSDARISATAMGLLPFLGQGHTHKSGPYKSVVDRGLYFLTRSMRYSGNNGSLHERGGQMYGHGLASIALCEAYGLTHDPALKTPAQAAINYIVMAQDTGGGGWRYTPRQPGDTSVVGWQLMALKSGHMAYLKIPEETVAGANRFLDDVQDEYGARYGYTGPGGGAATSAIGLLCRLYLGWKPSQDAMQRGVGYLERMGPSIGNPNHGAGKNNFYYNYYATQVMHHVGGYPWDQWNAVMRDYLVKNQSQKGHAAGSWYFEGNDHGQGQGGRLYFTALSAMILEVYYRHMPLYRQQSVLDKFGK